MSLLIAYFIYITESQLKHRRLYRKDFSDSEKLNICVHSNIKNTQLLKSRNNTRQFWRVPFAFLLGYWVYLDVGCDWDAPLFLAHYRKQPHSKNRRNEKGGNYP